MRKNINLPVQTFNNASRFKEKCKHLKLVAFVAYKNAKAILLIGLGFSIH